MIQADEREGLAGHWQKTFPVTGGTYVRFSALRRANGIDGIRRAGPARILWLDDSGQRVLRDEPSHASYRPGERPRAEPEFPGDAETKQGWTTVTGQYRVPSAATQAVVELHFRWRPPNSSIEWAQISLPEIAPPQPRRARLATVHYRPTQGNTPTRT